jgi:hypothetical protein
MLASQAKRTRRIEKRCVPAVVAALHAGQISPRSADLFLRLSPAAQRRELARRLSESATRDARHQRVAGAIKSYLDGLGSSKVDLLELTRCIERRVGSSL